MGFEDNNRWATGTISKVNSVTLKINRTDHVQRMQPESLRYLKISSRQTIYCNKKCFDHNSPFRTKMMNDFVGLVNLSTTCVSYTRPELLQRNAIHNNCRGQILSS